MNSVESWDIEKVIRKHVGTFGRMAPMDCGIVLSNMLVDMGLVAKSKRRDVQGVIHSFVAHRDTYTK